MLLAMVLMALCAVSVNAGERIPLTADGFFQHTGWGINAVKTGPFNAAYILNEPSGCPFGDSDCNAYLDLGAYSKLIVSMAGCDGDGNLNGSTPRIFINSDKTDGANNHFYPLADENYYTKEDEATYVVDLAKIKKEQGFVFITAIKGSAWNTKAIIYSIEVEKDEKAQPMGWTPLINNGDLTSDDVESFPVSKNGPTNGDTANDRPAIVTGEDGSRYLMVASDDNATETWSTQFFLKFNEELTEGAQWRLSFDVRADRVAHVTTSAQGEPRKYNAGGVVPEFDVSIDWQTITVEPKTVTSSEIGSNGFKSIAFDLNNDKETSNNFYFRNINLEVLKSGVMADFFEQGIVMNFGFATNVVDIVKAAKLPRLVYPEGTAVVKKNGQPIELISVEAYADGRFVIYPAEQLEATDEITIDFTNPTGDLQLKYTNGPTPGSQVPNGEAKAYYNGDLSTVEDLYPYALVNPTIVNASPEQGSFNIPASLKEFTVNFDKKANLAEAKATLDGQELTIKAVDADEEGLATKITLTYGGADLADGTHEIHLTKIYPEFMLDEDVYTDTIYKFSVGTIDITDLPYDVIPVSYFNNCAGNGVPEGYILYADGATPEQRTPDKTYGSGARMMDFAAGGDFTKGLYMRTWYTSYGEIEDHPLTLEAGKTYNISFNSAMWTNSAAKYMKFQIVNSSDEEVFAKVVENGPGLGEKRDAVTGSTFTSVNFTAPANGNYILKFIVASNAEGTPTDNGWQNGVILANVKMTYVPATFGAMEMYNLTNATNKAKEKQATYGDERYAGEALTAFNDAISKAEAGLTTFTSPSEVNDAMELLTKTAATLDAHAKLVKDYDDKIQKGADVVDQNKANKFATLQQYADLKAVVDKYEGTSTMTNVGTEEEPNWQRIRDWKKLTDDTELAAAIKELDEIVNLTSLMFTTGASETGNTGVKVLVDRLRRGAETLKKFDAENAAIAEADNAITDDDEVVEKLKQNIKMALYKKIMDGDAALFAEDPNTGEKPAYDMSVFFKNPNTYAFHLGDGLNEENVPGWTVDGTGAGITHLWTGGTHDTKGIADDVAFFGQGIVKLEQTISDLPAGVYTVILDATCWTWNSDGTKADCTDAYAYCKTSANEEGTFAGQVQMDNYGQYSGHHDMVMENVVVTDGQLTIGVQYNDKAQYVFDKIVAINMTAPAAGVNYADLYATGIDATAATAQVKAIELFDLNGQRIPAAKKGVVIVKKIMSDGTVQTQKVIK